MCSTFGLWFFSDLPYLYNICLKTSDKGGDASSLFTDAFLTQVSEFFLAPIISHKSMPPCARGL